ncbi:MAG: NosD domain-containing protein, partial [Thermoplasmatota archaeon]
YMNNSFGNILINNHIKENKETGIISVNSGDNLISYNNCSYTLSGEGIEIYHSENIDIKDNTITKNAFSGIHLFRSTGVHINNNILRNNKVHGIYINYRNNENKIVENIIEDNKNSGIFIQSGSNNNELRNNNLRNSGNNEENYGIQIHSSDRNLIVENKISSYGNSDLYLYRSSNNSISENEVISAGNAGLQLESSDNNILKFNDVSTNDIGIFLNNSISNTISNNTVINSISEGIYINADNYLNTLTNNLVFYTQDNYGVRIEESNDNEIYNNYFHNSQNARDEGVNRWNISKTQGVNIAGGTYLGGNLWSDYDEENEGAVDETGDGFADERYLIPGGNNIDELPLINQLRVENQPPNIPYKPSPKDEAKNVFPNTILTWGGGDPDPIDVVTYDVYFGTTSNPEKVSVNQSTTSYNPGQLQFEETYYWRIVAWDSFGLKSKGPLWNFTTIPEDDDVPPSKVTSVRVEDAHEGRLNLFWEEAEDNTGIEHYRIYREGTLIKNTSKLYYQDTGLENEVTYSYQISAVDLFGNEGEKSDPVSCIPTPRPDENRPPETPKIEGLTKGSQGVRYYFSIMSRDPDGDNITYKISWGDETNTTSVWMLSGQFFSVFNVWDKAGIYHIRVQCIDEKGLSSDINITTMFIDTISLNDIGYIMDMNSDGDYDIFVNIDTGMRTNLGKDNGNYLIDADGDYQWDYMYDNENDELITYNTPSELSGMALFCFGIVSAVSIAVLIAIVLAFKRLKEEYPSEWEDEELDLLEERIEQSEGWRKMKEKTDNTETEDYENEEKND